MRQLKFRAWDGETFYYVDLNETEKMFEDVPAYLRKALEIKEKQFFTGLQDRHGKDIYEGDIVKFHYFFGSLGEGLGVQESEHELTGVVEWGSFGWGVLKIKGEHWKGYTGYEDGEGGSNFLELMAMNESGIHEESFKIIGNIYENP